MTKGIFLRALGVAALALGTAAALAAPAPGTAPANTLFIAGSSALQNYIESRIQTNCDTTVGITKLVQDDGTATGSTSNYVAYLCAANGTAGVTAGNIILYYYTKSGGSYNGSVPVCTQSAVAHLVNAAAGTTSGTNCITVTAGTGIAAQYKCPVQATATDAPCVGASDLDSAFFVTPNVASGTAGFSAGACGTHGYSSTCPFLQEFGVAASNALYIKLQAQQGLTVSGSTQYVNGSSCGAAVPTAGGAAEVDFVDDSCRPSIPLPWLAGVAQDLVFDTTDLGFPLPNATTSWLWYIHRTPGSGTQAGFNEMTMNTPAAAAFGVPVPPGTRTNTDGWACKATGDVKLAINNALSPNCAAESGAAGAPALAMPLTEYGVAIVGIDNSPVHTVPHAATDDNWQFVKLNNTNPENVYNAAADAAYTNYPDTKIGNYPYIVQSCFNTITSGFSSTVCDPTLRTNLYADVASATTVAGECNTPAAVPTYGGAGGSYTGVGAGGIFCPSDSAACTAATPASRCLYYTRGGNNARPLFGTK